MTQERIINIQQMEKILNQTQDFLQQAELFLECWKTLLPEVKRLEDYYHSDQWQQDYQTSNQEHIPIPHGVLSEDAVYNTLGDLHFMAIQYLKLVTKIIAK